jgi:tRNA-splicing endonuclease subunit Sen34
MSGVLAGTLPQAAQQNLFLGMPLLLLPEEVVLLLEQGMKTPRQA